MNKIRVVVTFKDDLERITVDNVDMDISIIKNKAIPEWFEPSNGRDGWRGLIEEITDRASDDSGELAFEFNGNANAKEVFEKSLKEYGYSCISEARSEDEIIDDCFEEAERLVRQGNFERAIEQYEIAANAGSVEAEYLIADTICDKYFFEKDIELTDSSMTELSGKVIKYYTLAAEHGHPAAQYVLGALYSDGYVLEQNDAKAAEWFEKSAEQGHPRAQYELGQCYNDGCGVEQNKDVALEWYEKSAEQGDPDAQLKYVLYGPTTDDYLEKRTRFLIESAEHDNPMAQFLLGSAYHCGEGVEQDSEKAIEWYEASAEQGLSGAIYRLGECYLNGDGVERDIDKAILYFTEAADKEHTGAMNRLGDCYLHGWGVEENEKTAFEYYKQAGDLEDPEGMYNEFHCYYIGWGVDENINTAIDLLNTAADLGYTPALIRLGKLYQEGKELARDYNKALEYFREAENQGSLYASYEIGLCYLEGLGVEKDPKKAFDIFCDLSVEDLPEAQNMVGECHQNGWGVSKNEIEAAKIFKEAAEQGNEKAQYNLGMCYLTGVGVSRDTKKAKELFEESEFLTESSYRLGLCYLYGIGTQKDEELAERYIRRAAIRGYTDAEYYLGKMYLSSKESYKKQEAREHLQKAAEKGHIGAMYELGQCFLDGTGGNKDYIVADKWFSKIAESAMFLSNVDSKDQIYIPLALYSLGEIYYKGGFGTSKNLGKSEQYFQKAIAFGNINAYGKIGEIYYYGNEINKAVEYYFQGFEKGDEISRRNLLKKSFVQEAIQKLSLSHHRVKLMGILSQVANDPKQTTEFAQNSYIIFESNAKKFLLKAIEQLKSPIK